MGRIRHRLRNICGMDHRSFDLSFHCQPQVIVFALLLQRQSFFLPLCLDKVRTKRQLFTDRGCGTDYSPKGRDLFEVHPVYIVFIGGLCYNSQKNTRSEGAAIIHTMSGSKICSHLLQGGLRTFRYLPDEFVYYFGIGNIHGCPLWYVGKGSSRNNYFICFTVV